MEPQKRPQPLATTVAPGKLEAVIVDLMAKLAARDDVPDNRWLTAQIRPWNRGIQDTRAHVKKRILLPFFLSRDEKEPGFWESRGLTADVRRRLVAMLQAKPRRTASGVATITVISKPWPCSGTCRFCPNDLRMPKSYLADEPACQRAEQAFFDPYLQVSSRLATLHSMGHPTGKVELIVLGGTWTEYPEEYRCWFTGELFRALNDGPGEKARAERHRLREAYRAAGFSDDGDDRARWVASVQGEVDRGELTYNQGWQRLYGEDGRWRALMAGQVGDLEEVRRLQGINEEAQCRCVGLSFETRPDALDDGVLDQLRALGCTKVQIGVQSLDGDRLLRSDRPMARETLERAFSLLRRHGFKIHAHMMANLPGADPEADKADFRALVEDPAFIPDEIKLYPCALIGGTALERDWRRGLWRPYGREELLDVLVSAVRACPPHIRISRMVRDFSAQDIVAGVKEANLRQAVEAEVRDGAVGRTEEPGAASSSPAQAHGFGASGQTPGAHGQTPGAHGQTPGAHGQTPGAHGSPTAPLTSPSSNVPVGEIRFREIGVEGADPDDLAMAVMEYRTIDSRERFLSWTTSVGAIAGFCRLSLPEETSTAMIRELHVYGQAVDPGHASEVSQHHGLGRALVEEAALEAAEAGYGSLDVISAVGTRPYYRRLGFRDHGLYQRREL